jgi:hypothetical protein
MEELRRRLLNQAFLYDDPGAFMAGVDAVLREAARVGDGLGEEPTGS